MICGPLLRAVLPEPGELTAQPRDRVGRFMGQRHRDSGHREDGGEFCHVTSDLFKPRRSTLHDLNQAVVPPLSGGIVLFQRGARDRRNGEG